MKKLLTTIGFALVLLLVVIAIGFSKEQQGTAEWQDVQDQVLPQLVRASNKEQVNIVNEPLSTTIDIAYVINKLETYDFIMEESLKTWEIDKETLQEAAMANLEKLAKNTAIEVTNVGDSLTDKYIILEVDDGYAATRLLSASVRKEIEKELGDTAIAAIPTRDFLIFWNQNFSLGEDFAEQVQKEYDAGGTYKLTQNLFVVSRGVIGMLTNTFAQ